MTTAEAARILEVSPDASAEQIEAKFQQLRANLEDRIAKAPTPGLKAKYRESLDELTKAFETLALAADSSALPVLKKEAGDRRPEAGGLAPARAVGQEGAGGRPQAGSAGHSHATRRKSGKEFLVVAVIAVAVLAAGGWWVMKVRGENAEKARIAAEAKAEAERRAAAEKAEAERKAADEKRLAEEKRQAEEAEKTRMAAAAKAEQERLDKLQVTLRTELAELRTRWEIFERAERDAERAATESKSDLRSLRDGPAGRQRELELRAEVTADYAQWLADHLLRHPVRTLRSRAEELVSARAVDEAQPLVKEMKTEFAKLEEQIRTEQARRLAITGTLELTSDPAGLNWSLEDAFGRKRTGVTPARVPELGVGPARVTFSRSGWPEQIRSITIERGQIVSVASSFVSGSLRVESDPVGAEVVSDGKVIGHTPMTLTELIPGKRAFELRLNGYRSATLSGMVEAGQELRLTAALEKKPIPEAGKAFTIPELGLVIVPISLGTFMMGSTEGRRSERPVTEVKISRPFWLGRTEVTQSQWETIMGTNPSLEKGANLPVSRVSWVSAAEYCRRLTDRERAAGRLPEGYAYTLPTEAQWEYACRAGTTGDYAGDLNAMAWYDRNSDLRVHSVGQKQPNEWGLYDMHGNVWEWCLDWYDTYPGGTVTDPAGPPEGRNRALRGGSWKDWASDCRSAVRSLGEPDNPHFHLVGFRVALSPAR